MRQKVLGDTQQLLKSVAGSTRHTSLFTARLRASPNAPPPTRPHSARHNRPPRAPSQQWQRAHTRNPKRLQTAPRVLVARAHTSLVRAMQALPPLANAPRPTRPHSARHSRPPRAPSHHAQVTHLEVLKRLERRLGSWVARRGGLPTRALECRGLGESVRTRAFCYALLHSP